MKYSRYSRNLLSIQYIIDFSILVSLSLCFLNIQYVESVGYKYTLQYLIIYHYKVIILFLVSWYFISVNVKLYVGGRFSGIIAILRKNLYQVLLFSIIVFAVSGFKTSDLFSNRLSIYFLVTLFIVTSFVKIILFFTIKIYRSYGGNYRRVVFVDENINTYSFIKLLSKRKDYGLVNCGFFLSSIKDNEKRKKYNFELNKFKSFLLEEKIQIIFYSLNGNFSQQIHDDLVYLVQKLHIEISFIPSEIYDSYSSLNLEYYDTYPILTFKKFPLDNFWNQFLKRMFDIVFSLVVIIFIISWLFPLIGLVILLDSGSPVFYLQKRVGLRGKVFNCFKFRTMKKSVDNNIKATVKGDIRITRFGKILRKTSLDEFPQFINVLIGNMSVVGPRPHMIIQDEHYNDIILKYSLRHYVKPGITGLAQSKGFRGEIATKEDIHKRVIADAYYVKNWSFLLDVIIIVRTFFNIISGDKKAF
ncbi:exopolysaccharide biosynthesis polyprenyl glycosylphosphotransferase [Apibacter muscae]|uniref:Exopolysaccharide biosynthesis polyprenyl glycosylphosphotransferase n=1 Tax=Apibacter muscae TaxID=2509004 RepID=A0A563DFR3_9FLAO|nr:exopolysaccharide biosynthesis polyprenyl glycosylphosphotransferase [Apibacter muscae]TWP29040.1 exopolysaccharide biosynthesis polyprenyl glycosylphosphotransferase [Apibacter muscae]TWP30379.1 exopolysaccharide biosynthesis polyprenyl glycosylphosphotransferase [Apibacter muscae]